MTAPIKAFLWPVRFPTANPTIRVLYNGTAATLTLTVSANTDYYVSADDLIAKLQTALRTHPAAGASSITVTLTATNTLGISAPHAIQIVGSHGGTTVDITIFGFVAGADSSSGTAITAPNATKGYWSPDKPHKRDLDDQPIYLGSVVESSGTGSRAALTDTGKKERTIRYSLVRQAKVLDRFAATTEPYGALEYAWGPSGGFMCAAAIRVYDDRTDRATYRTYRSKTAARPWTEDESVSLVRYDVALELLRAA